MAHYCEQYRPTIVHRADMSAEELHELVRQHAEYAFHLSAALKQAEEVVTSASAVIAEQRAANRVLRQHIRDLTRG